MNAILVLALFGADHLAVYEVPGATVGVAWGNGTGGTVAYYEPLFDHLNANGVSVVAATTGWSGTGQEQILAGLYLRNVLGCSRVVVMGHSQGGTGAANAAAARPDIFDAVCPIMPGPNGASGLLPCFIVTGQLDTLSRPSVIQSQFVDRYQGPKLHAMKRMVGHFGWDHPQIMRRVTEFVLDDPALVTINVDSGWRVYVDTLGN